MQLYDRSRVRLATLGLLATLFLPHRAEAMRVRGEVHLVAWSSDGAAALLHDGRAGPEGGGSSAYLVLSAAGVRRFLLSSDFSPGDGSRPQSVPEGACTRRAEELAALLKRERFDGIAVHPAGCGDEGRYQVVTGEQRQVDRASASAVTAAREVRGWRLRGDGDTTRLVGARGTALPLSGKAAELSAFVSPDDRMVIVFREKSGDHQLVQAFALDPSGAARPIPLKADG